MSFSSTGVTFNKTKWIRNRIFRLLFRGAEGILSVLFVISLAAPMVFPNHAYGALGVSKYLSYQGRLTDTNGNPLGGAGTNYCFSFSIFDASSAGNKLWPSTATTTSILMVTNGIFNTSIGDVSTFDFSSNDTTYLNVDVASQISGSCTGVSWETLLPRQKLDSVAYAQVAANLYGGNARIGTGTGVNSGSQKYLHLDVMSQTGVEILGTACPSGSVNGSVWYNSSSTRALMCAANVIKALDNASEIVSLNITGNTAGTPAAISTGAISLAGGPNITLSQVGNAISISAGAGGGGGGATVSHWPPFPVGLAASTNNSGTTAAGTNVTASFHVAPLQLGQAVAFTRINMVGLNITTIAGTGSASVAHMLGIYTLNGGTALSLSTSYMFRQEISQSSVTAETHRWYWGTNSTANSSSTAGNVASAVAGIRILPLFVSAGGNTFSAGQYWVAYAQTNVTGGSNVVSANSLMYISQSQSSLGGQIGSAVTLPPFPLIGQFSSTTVLGNYTSPFMPSSINTTAITNTGGSSQWKWPYVNFLGK
ncbi:MAG: hypothetical protein HZB11_00330 [Candidatus Yonathbacteria bacterium]|nr:hypothetical protein [Candidatus Yonathbacteria bacterium]